MAKRYVMWHPVKNILDGIDSSILTFFKYVVALRALAYMRCDIVSM